MLCEYDYDAWGNCKLTVVDVDDYFDDEPFIVYNNPFRWKGYYYDAESGLYYCGYRYYSPELCRWISPDSLDYLDLETLGGIDLYCYCNNNPVNIGLAKNRSLVLSDVIGENNIGYSNSFNIFTGLNVAHFNALDLTKDIFISLGEVGSRIAWGLTKNGRAFLDFHYSAYGINGYTALDNLPSTSAKIFKGIGIGLMALDVIEAGYYSYKNGHSFGQGALNVGLTIGKNILIYNVSTSVATAVGTWAGAKLGASLGSFAGPIGFAIGAVAGAAVGWIIDEFGDMIIDWVVGWFD